MKKKFLTSIFAAGSLFVLAACGGTPADAPESPGATSDGAGAEEELIPLTVGVSPSTSGTGFWASVEGGHFVANGLDVTPKIMKSGSEAVAMLMGGDIQFAAVDVPGTAAGFQNGMTVKLMAPISQSKTDPDADSSDGIYVLEDSDIQSPKDLEGRTVGVSSLVGVPATMLQVAVETDGGDPDKVNLVEVPNATSVSAVEQGVVDAAIVFEPILAQAKSSDLRLIGDGETSALGAMKSAWGATESYLEENPDIAKRFEAAILAGNADLADSVAGDRELYYSLVLEHTTIEADVLELMVAPSYSSDPFSEEATNTMLDLLYRMGSLEEPVQAADIMWSALLD